MKRISLIISLALLLNLSLINAITQQEIDEAKDLIDSKANCDKLTNEQLEIIGEYYMEQMHPGEQHEMMDQMMGGEGSDDLKQMHITMGRNFYCEENGMMGMMPMMMDMMGGGNMMNEGMMGQNMQNGMMQGMSSGGYYGYWNFLNVLHAILLIGLIILVYLWIIKLWRDFYGKKK